MCDQNQDEGKHLLCTQTAAGMKLFRSSAAFDYWNQRKCACAGQEKLNFQSSLSHTQLLAGTFTTAGNSAPAPGFGSSEHLCIYCSFVFSCLHHCIAPHAHEKQSSASSRALGCSSTAPPHPQRNAEPGRPVCSKHGYFGQEKEIS